MEKAVAGMSIRDKDEKVDVVYLVRVLESRLRESRQKG